MGSSQEATAAPDVSLIIVNWNTRDRVRHCLHTVRDEAQRFGVHRLETIVVDNASADGSAALIAAEFPWVNLIQNSENVGFARANNQGIAYSQGRYVLLLNSDTEMHPGCLAALVAFMQTHPRAAAAGARLLNQDGSLQPSCQPMLTPGREFWRLVFLDHLWPRATYRMRRWDMQRPRPVAVIKGACLLLRREALRQVGLLDERYFMYTEEVDICYRLAQAGWTLWYVPAAVVTHDGEASSRQAAQAMYIQLYRSKVQFYRKTGGERQARYFKRLLKLAYAPRRTLVAAAAWFWPTWRARAETYRRLLAELPQM